MEHRTRPLSPEVSGVQMDDRYRNNVVITDLSEELLEEEDFEAGRRENGLTEVKINIEGKEIKTLIDTGSEISVISEHVLDELKEINKNIPSLPVAGVTIVGITGIRSKRVTKQVHLNMIINGVGCDNTFLVVQGLNLDVILGNDFLIKHKAVIDFHKRVLELNSEVESVRINFERVVDAVRISGVRVIHDRVNRQEVEVSMNVCSESKIECDENVDQLWDERALKFCSEGGVIGSLSLIHI